MACFGPFASNFGPLNVQLRQISVGMAHNVNSIPVLANVLELLILP